MITPYVLLSLAALSLAAEVATEKLPQCVRPKDFSQGKFVASYETCLRNQDEFCQKHHDDKGCAQLERKPGKPFFKVTVDDIDPTQRCKILKDGSYQCIQDPVRIMTPTTAEAAPPAAPATGSATPQPNGDAPKSIQVPTDDSGGTSGEGATPIPVPIRPPPPKK